MVDPQTFKIDKVVILFRMPHKISIPTLIDTAINALK